MFQLNGGAGRGVPIVQVVLAMVVLAIAVQAAPQKVPVAETDRHYVRYDDGSLTLNDVCPVRLIPLGPVKAPVFVNGRPVGFC